MAGIVKVKTIYLRRKLQGLAMNLGSVVHTSSDLDAEVLPMGVAIVWSTPNGTYATLVPYESIDNVDFFKESLQQAPPERAKSIGKKEAV
jgi:hypothetical protein